MSRSLGGNYYFLFPLKLYHLVYLENVKIILCMLVILKLQRAMVSSISEL